MTGSESTGADRDEAAHQAEVRDAERGPGPDRPPTAAEEEAAGRAEPLDPDVARSYEEMAERGAAVRGEGEIDGVHPGS